MAEIKYHHLHFSNLSPYQLYEIIKLRIEVFVVEQTCLYQDLDDKDAHCYHLMGRTDNEISKIASYARIVPENISYEGYVSIGRVIVREEFRQYKEGYRLMKNAIHLCQELWPGKPIKLSAQAHLQNFYVKCGFTAVGEVYLEDDIPHIAMVRES
jgi:ElaA protein